LLLLAAACCCLLLLAAAAAACCCLLLLAAAAAAGARAIQLSLSSSTTHHSLLLQSVSSVLVTDSACSHHRTMSSSELKTLNNPSASVDDKEAVEDGLKTARPVTDVNRHLLLDRFVLFLVVAGIIVFVSFQIKECIEAYQQPASSVSVVTYNRTFPGLMICPYSLDLTGKGVSGACPLWSPNASLAFDFDSKNPSAGWLWNSNADAESNRQSDSRCGLNLLSAFDSSSVVPYLLFSNQAHKFSRKVLVKNSQKPTLNCERELDLKKRRINPCRIPSQASEFPYLCPSFTPPNVECLAFEASFFDEDPALDSACNPMRELRANSLDAVYLGVSDFGLNDVRKDSATGFRYQGLLPQPKSNISFLKNPNSSMFLSTNRFAQQIRPLTNPIYSDISVMMFSGLVAVFYDAGRRPSQLDFSSASSGRMSNEVLGSVVLLSTDCQCDPDTSVCATQKKKCDVILRPQQTVEVAQIFEDVYVNTLLETRQLLSNQSLSIRPSSIIQNVADSSLGKWTLSIAFNSHTSVLRKQVLQLSIFNTVSIIVSTAATIWGFQEQIKQYTLLVIAKVREYRFKRHAARPKTANPILVFS
jgi:hypothetical protein